MAKLELWNGYLPWSVDFRLWPAGGKLMQNAHFDIYRKLMDEPAFERNIRQMIGVITGAEQKQNHGVVGQSVRDIIRSCAGNFSLLVPYYFPQFSVGTIKPMPLSTLRRPFLMPMQEVLPYSSLTLRGSRQIGKTIGAVSRLRIGAHLITNHRSMYIAPYTEHIKTFANKFREMERKFRFPVRDTKYRQNLYFKEYPNGASIEVLRILTSAADARGKTIDDLFFDEFQDFDAGLLAEVMQVQRASLRPSLVKSGTSKTMDTPLELAFQESSQGYWHVRAGDGKTFLNCGDPKTALAILQKEGPTCPITSKPLNMLDGFFVHAYAQRLKDLNIGLHLPQLIVQDFVRDPNEWAKIWNYYTAFGTERTLTEVLGIPMAEGSREITREHLQATCVLPEPEVLMKRAQQGYYPYIASGLDWGGSDYNEAKKTKLSYTAHVILGATPDGKVDILHMRDYAGMDYEEIAYLVMQDHHRFRANGLGSDFGGGQLYHHLLRRHSDINPNRHFIMQYRPPNEAFLEPLRDSALFNAYGLNRTESITRIFMGLRDIPQEIRCYPWHLAEKHLEQCLNLYRTPCESYQTGRNFFKYHRHGAKPDDILHAMNFGYTMLRVLRGDRLAVEPMVHREIIARLGRTSASHNTSGLRRVPGRPQSG